MNQVLSTNYLLQTFQDVYTDYYEEKSFGNENWKISTFKLDHLTTLFSFIDPTLRLRTQAVLLSSVILSRDYHQHRLRIGTVDSVIFFFLLQPSSSSCTRAALYTSSFSFYCPIPLSVFSSPPELLSIKLVNWQVSMKSGGREKDCSFCRNQGY